MEHAKKEAVPMVSVELLERVEGVMGGHWNRGERVGFSPLEAASLIRRGAARPLPKAPDGPGADKMVREPIVKK